MKSKTKFKQTEIGEIPEEWEIIKIGDLGKVVTGKTPPTIDRDNYNGDVPFVCIPDLGKNVYVSKTNKTLTEKGVSTVKNCLLPKNSVVVSCIATIGLVGIIDKPSVANQQINSIIPNEKTTTRFLYYRLQNFENLLSSYGGGGSVFNIISKNKFENIPLVIPPLDEQQQIASILSSLDDKIELNKKANKTLEEIGKALFKRWFVDFEFPDGNGKSYKSSGGEMVESELGEIPEGWEVSTIGKRLETFLGGTPSRDRDKYWINGTVPWINSGKVNEFRVTEVSEYITEEALNNSAAKLLPKGSVVIAITGATLGQYSLLEIDSSFNQSVVGIKESESIKKEFIYHWIAFTIEELINSQTGGAQQHINKQVVDSHRMLIPKQKILNQYYRITTPIFNQISKNCFEIDILSKIRDSLLPRLMSGKLRVN